MELQNPPENRHDTVLPLPLCVNANAWAVDAACSGNPGPMEYQCIDLATGQRIFHFGPTMGTNNILFQDRTSINKIARIPKTRLK